jgi:hypothetical protein
MMTRQPSSRLVAAGEVDVKASARREHCRARPGHQVRIGKADVRGKSVSSRTVLIDV